MTGHRRVLTLTITLALIATTTIATTVQAAPLSPPGELWAWGNDQWGQLGIGDNPCDTGSGGVNCTPTRADLDGDEIVQVDGGRRHAVALDEFGGVYNWGDGTVLAGGWDASAPDFVGELDGDLFVEVAAGDAHSLALADDGRVWSWGRNDEGQLGHGYFGDDPNEPNPDLPFVNAPELVLVDNGVPLTDVVAIAAGGAHSLAIQEIEEGVTRVWAWGSNSDGQLGNGGGGGSSAFAVPVYVDVGDDVYPQLSGIEQIAAGGRHSLALSHTYEPFEYDLFAWGDGSFGQTGLGDNFSTDMARFVPVNYDGAPPLPEAIAQIAAGESHSLLLTSDGEVRGTGANWSGQLGRGEDGNPTDMEVLFDTTVGLEQASGLAAGGDTSYAIEDGEVHAWGDGLYGQFGDGVGGGEFYFRQEPGVVEGLSDVTGIAAGAWAGYAIVGQPVEPPPVETNLALFVEDALEGPASDRPGVDEIDLSTVDISSLPLFQGELASAPLRSSPLRSSPLRSSPVVDAPLRSSPLRSSPLRSSPLRSSPLRSSELEATPLRSSPLRSSPLRSSPLRSSPLRSSTLAEVPLLRDGGWAPLLTGTPYDGLALQSVRFADVLDLDPALYPQLADLSLDDVDWSNSALKRASIVGFLFGGLTLEELATAGAFCGALPGDFCTDHGVDGTWTLLELELAGAALGDIGFLPNIPIEEIDWSGQNTPVYHYDLLFVDVVRSPLGDLTLDVLPPGLVDCDPTVLDLSLIDCAKPAEATLAQAVDAGAIPPYSLGDPNPAILGRILEDDGLVGANGLAGPLRIADVIPTIIDPAKLHYSSVPLFRLLSGLPVDGNLVSYRAMANLACDDVDDFQLRVTVPRGFRYQPGSAELGLDGAELIGTVPEPVEAGLPADLGDGGQEPTPQRQPLTFVFDDTVLECEGGGSPVFLELTFRALPFVDLGSFEASLELFVGDAEDPTASLDGAATYTVLDPYSEGSRDVEAGHLYLGWLPEGGEVEDEFVVTLDGDATLEPGTQVTAILSHLPADYDLRIDGPSSAPLRSSPLRSSPLRSSPLRSSPIEDEGLSGDPDGQQVQSDDLQDIPTTEDTLTVSANRGLEPDVVTTVVTASTAGDPLTLRVSSYLGSASDQPYSLQVLVEEPPALNCDPLALDRAATFAGGTEGQLPAGPGEAGFAADARTLVLYNRQRLEALYSADDLVAIETALEQLEDDPEAEALLFPIDGDAGVRAAYAAWDADPCAPEAANDVVRSILEVTDPYVAALDELRYVTIVGSDDIVPSARIPDLVTLSNQRDYYQELVFGGIDNPLSAAQAMSYVTSDSAYTDLDPIAWLGHELLIPDLAGGRLVETPDEIVAAIEQYLDQPYVKTDRSLVTAYDFLVHGGEDTQASLADKVGTANARFLINEDWTRQDVLDELALDPNLIAINAHYDHSRSLPAIGEHIPIPANELLTSQDILPDDVLGSGLSAGALFFTVGCNAGINVPALSGVGLDPEHERLLDWAQAVAQIDGAGIFANTGFGYGDTELSAYSERLMSLFADRLDGSMTVGQAAVAARKAYVAELGLLGVYDDKSLTEATLYGLPFVRVGEDGVSLAADEVYDPFAGDPDTGGLETDPVTGLQAAPFDLTPFPANLEDARVQTSRGDYFEVDGHRPLAMHYRPLQPSMSLTLPEPDTDQAIGDVLITGLESTVVDGDIDAVFSRPTVDSSAFEPEPVIRDLAFPSTIGTVTPEASLVVMPGQYRGEEDPTTGQQILYTQVEGKVFYPPAGPTPAGGLGIQSADTERPFFRRVEGVRNATSVLFEVEVDPAAYVLVLYHQPTAPGGTSVWKSLELVQGAGGIWTGTATPGEEVGEFFVQAVSADGLVGSARGKGFDFLPRDGDMDPPTIEITVPTSGQEFEVGEVVSAEYTCSDEDGGSGIALCTAWDPVNQVEVSDQLDTSGGPRTFTVRAVDHAGNETIETVNYGAGYAFEGFFDPVKNPTVINEMKAGRSIPVKFRLSDADGPITDTAAVTHIIVRKSSVCTKTASAEAVEGEVAGSTAGLRYDPGAEQFVFTWQTDRKTKGCFELELMTNDGAKHVAWFKLT
jgi:alpha-tubulin suppressor-like RCC1 family protein